MFSRFLAVFLLSAVALPMPSAWAVRGGEADSTGGAAVGGAAAAAAPASQARGLSVPVSQALGRAQELWDSVEGEIAPYHHLSNFVSDVLGLAVAGDLRGLTGNAFFMEEWASEDDLRRALLQGTADTIEEVTATFKQWPMYEVDNPQSRGAACANLFSRLRGGLSHKLFAPHAPAAREEEKRVPAGKGRYDELHRQVNTWLSGNLKRGVEAQVSEEIRASSLVRAALEDIS